MNHLLSISAMPAYRNLSVEQIRLRDYIAAGRLNAEGLFPDLVAAASEATSSAAPEATTSTANPTEPSDSTPAKESSAPSPSLPAQPDPTPAVAPAAALTTDSRPERYATEVRDFYERYNPAKIPAIPAILKKYEGREELLLQKLDRKYVSNRAPAASAVGVGILSPRSDVDSVPSSPVKFPPEVREPSDEEPPGGAT
jgi:hypothetical protein